MGNIKVEEAMRELTLMLLYLSRFTQREKFHEDVYKRQAEGIRASYPPSGEKYYLTNEQGEQLGDGARCV